MKVVDSAPRLHDDSARLSRRLRRAGHGVGDLVLSQKQIICLGLLALCLIGASIAAAPGILGLFGGALALLMMGVALFDWRFFIIPDEFSAAALVIGAGHAAIQTWSTNGVITALVQGAGVALSFYLVRAVYRGLRKREGIGLGDVKLAGVAGVWLSLSMVPIAVELAALAAIVSYFLKYRSLSVRSLPYARLPFGAFLGPTIWLCWLLDAATAGTPTSW
jgi:leader peptidase (prepilin peptidase) / N-methyltransferase